MVVSGSAAFMTWKPSVISTDWNRAGVLNRELAAP